MKLISAMTEINDHRLVAFGGTQDEDEDDELQSEFLDEMNFYDTKTSRWFPAVVKSKGFLNQIQISINCNNTRFQILMVMIKDLVHV